MSACGATCLRFHEVYRLMAKQERKGSDWVSAKVVADYLCLTAKTIRKYRRQGLLRGRQRVPRGRVEFLWDRVVKFGRGID